MWMKLLVKDNFINLGLTLLFFAISLLGLLHHTLWLDEAWHYLISHESESLTDIFSLSYNSGHPKLWNIIVYLVLNIWRDVFAIQIFHSVIATITAFLIFKFSPFKLIDKCFIVFGYYFLFEYNIIGNHYALGIMLIVLSVVLFLKNKSLILIATVLALAANCHLFSLIVALCLFIYMVSEKKEASDREKTFALGVFTLMIGLSIWQIIPPQKDLEYFRSFESLSLLRPERFQRVFTSATKGLLNVPDFRSNSFWNSNLISNINLYVTSIVSVVLVATVFITLRVAKKVLLIYFVSIGLIMGVVFYFPLGSGVRYWGYYYILLVLCFWLISGKRGQPGFSSLFFRTILIIQFLVSFPVYYFTLSRPFSNSEVAANTLVGKGYSNTISFAENIGLGFPFVVYADRAIYYPAIKEFCKCTANNFTRRYTAKEFIESSAMELRAMKKDSCILIMNQVIPTVVVDEFSPQVVIKKVGIHTGAIVPSEDYFLYLMKLKTD